MSSPTNSFPFMADREKLHKVLHELDVRVGVLADRTGDGCHCNLVTSVIFDELGLCPECGRPLCPDCKVCPPCGGDGHDEGCPREGDEYTPEQRTAIERESVENALENDRCGICHSTDHFREDHR